MKVSSAASNMSDLFFLLTGCQTTGAVINIFFSTRVLFECTEPLTLDSCTFKISIF